jgi:hypothetical protein
MSEKETIARDQISPSVHCAPNSSFALREIRGLYCLILVRLLD